MKFNKLITLILIVFLKTETLLSQNNLFNVNNIELEKNDKTTNDDLADKAIKKGFDQLIVKILLKEDVGKFKNLNFSTVKQLVTFYQISNLTDEKTDRDLVNFSVTFDKEKVHRLFFERGISYSDISDRELYVLPIFIENDEVNIFNNNFFYTNWNNFYKNDLIEFILPLENIEIIQKINKNKNSLINLNISNLFEEYPSKNLAIVLIEKKKNFEKKIYIKSRIQEKNISKSINITIRNEKLKDYKEIIIEDLKIELIDLVKAANLIDIRTPSFLNVKLNLNKKSNLVELNSRLQNIDLIENIFVQEFNKDTMRLRIKYLGKLEKILNQLKKKNINLQFINEQWVIKTL